MYTMLKFKIRILVLMKTACFLNKVFIITNMFSGVKIKALTTLKFPAVTQKPRTYIQLLFTTDLLEQDMTRS